MHKLVGRWQILLAGAVVGGLTTAAEAANGMAVDRALITFVIVFGYSLVIAVLQGRSETMSTLAGNPVDERWRLINDRATSFMALVGVAVSLGGFVLAEAAGRDALGFAVVAAAMGFAYLVGVGWYRARL
jgi:hypothetical protein